ncbi:MAG TPA: lipid II flippase MurJ, partial [Nitriliruptorales bacterium]|nr:lipid II flippase MurJ [Nitriliruptorales bacterium]
MTDVAPEPGAGVEPRPPVRGSRRNSALVAGGILLSRLAGFARERAMAFFFGNSGVLDAFRAALRIPNLLQNLLGEGVLSASFIPVYSRLLAQRREEEAGRLAGAVAGLLTLVAGGLVLVGVLLAPALTTVLTPGFTGRRYALTVTLLRILFPGIGFLVLSAWCLGVLNSHRRFFLSYVAPVLWNAAQIAALVAFGLGGLAAAPLAVALAWGAFVGGALQFLVQLPGVLRLSRRLRLSLDLDLAGVRDTLRAFGPVVAGRGVVQLLAFIDTVLASLLVTGALAALGYAQQLFV